MKNSRNTEFEIFTMLAFDVLRGSTPDGKRYPALHTVWSGYNAAARDLFKGMDVVAQTKSMAEEGLVHLSLAKGGALLKPTERLLFTLDKKQKVLAQTYRAFLREFKQKQEAQRECRRKTNVASEAAKCLSEGDFSTALQKLGYS